MPYIQDNRDVCSSPFDELYPWRGMQIVERPLSGTCVSIPKFYYKLSQTSTDNLSIKISMVQHEGFEVSPAHCDRGDGRGERDIVYIGKYHSCHNYKSIGGLMPAHDISLVQARQGISTLGPNIWQQDFFMRFTIWLLYLVEYANFNSRNTIGRGGCEDSLLYVNTGYTILMPYPTGTMIQSRSHIYASTQYRYIEGLWDLSYDWIDGIFSDKLIFKIVKKPSDFGEISKSISTNVTNDSGNYVNRLVVITTPELPTIFGCYSITSNMSASISDSWDIGGNKITCNLYGGGVDGVEGLLNLNSKDINYSTTTYARISCRLMDLND